MDRPTRLEKLTEIRTKLLRDDVREAAVFFSEHSPPIRDGEDAQTYYYCTPMAAIGRSFSSFCDLMKNYSGLIERSIKRQGPDFDIRHMSDLISTTPKRTLTDLQEIESQLEALFPDASMRNQAQGHLKTLIDFNATLRDEGSAIVSDFMSLLPPVRKWTI